MGRQNPNSLTSKNVSRQGRNTCYPVPPCNRPIRTRKDDHSEIMLHCRICHNEYTTYEEFYAHNPCKIDETDDEADDEDEEGDETEEDEEDDHYTAPWLPGGHQAHLARRNAEASLKYFNSQDGGKKYEFVEGGPLGGASISRGPILHINFKAKEKDNPDAQVETFFAQLRLPTGSPEVDCCVSLGPTQDLPHWSESILHMIGITYDDDPVTTYFTPTNV